MRRYQQATDATWREVDDALDGEYQVLEPVRARAGRPEATELFTLGICSTLAFFLASLLLGAASGRELEDVLRTSVRLAGISLCIIWPVLLFCYLSDDLGRTIGMFLAWHLERRRIGAEERVRLAQVQMQETVSLAHAELEQKRAMVARQALTVADMRLLPSGQQKYDEVEAVLVEAVRQAYDLADDAGWLPNVGPAPFSKRALGEGLYHEVRRRLVAPGERFGVAGAPPVAMYDQERRQWRLNIKSYPTYADAVAALVGRLPEG